ncbi:DUF4382 domain-containing protein [Winogradskyella sp.]|uniref:DUF4382 domain-containing protein n=2 Tax=Winogradskyella sp. TaxID=1883156 RepID=UPI003514B7C2
MNFLKKIITILAIVFAFSCNNSDDTKSSEAASLSIKLVDEPGDYEHVYVEVVDVRVKYDSDDFDEDDDENGWQSIGIINPGTYDLLELTAGVSLQLVEDEEIETGTIKQIRLILGNNNSVVLEGETEPRPLNTPSAQQSGLKIMVNQEIVGGFNYDFILDFDADESIVMAGNSGNINLKPVLRASLEVNSGAIAGNILPADIAVEVEATNGAITASTLTNDLGDFEIVGLPEGIYTVTITPDDDSMLNTVIINDVEVVIGQTTTIDPVILE